MMFFAMVWPHPVFDRYPVQEFFMYLSVFMLLLSFMQYCVRFYRIQRGMEYKV